MKAETFIKKSKVKKGTAAKHKVWFGTLEAAMDVARRLRLGGCKDAEVYDYCRGGHAVRREVVRDILGKPIDWVDYAGGLDG